MSGTTSDGLMGLAGGCSGCGLKNTPIQIVTYIRIINTIMGTAQDTNNTNANIAVDANIVGSNVLDTQDVNVTNACYK